jgi:hypothetical protein
MRAPKKPSRPKERKKRSQQEETTMNQPVETTAHKIAEETSRVGEHIAEASERVAQANAEMIAGQAESLQQTWQTGSELASRVMERSADQLTRALRGGGDDAQDPIQQFSSSVGAMVQSGSVLMNGARAILLEWVELVHKRTERSFDHMEAFIRCRTPQSLAAAQGDALRDYMEGVFEGTQKIAQISLRMVDEASRKVGENVERVRSAA